MNNRLNDLLALSGVPRWSIVSHSVPQDVGSHTYRVLVIFTELVARFGGVVELGDMYRVLEHDAAESRTGDIPTPAKAKMTISDDGAFCPWLFPLGFSSDAVQGYFELADMIEAYTFIAKYGIGDHAKRVSTTMYDQVREKCKRNQIVMDLVDEITFETGR